MKKKGQFYLIATIIIVGALISLITITNYSREDSSTSIYDLSVDLGIESENVLEHGIYNEFTPSEMNDLLENFTKTYSENLAEDIEIIFVVGDGLTATAYKYVIDENAVSDVVANTNTDNLQNPDSTLPKIGVKKIVPIKIREDITTVPIDMGVITISIEGYNYYFELKAGENFYFIISQKIGDETYVATNDASCESGTCTCTPTCLSPGEVDCGTTNTDDNGCEGNCNVPGTKESCGIGSSCVENVCVLDCSDTCSSLGYECGTHIICEQSTPCPNTCGEGYNCEVDTCINPNLVGWWKLDGDALDSSGENDGEVLGGAILTTDRFNVADNAYYFDGVNDYIDVGTDASLGIRTDLTIALWVKTSDSGAYKQLVSKNVGTIGSYLFSISSLKPNVYLSGVSSWISSSNTIQSGEWTHVAFTYDGSQITHYKNGVENGIFTGYSGLINSDPNSDVWIGARSDAFGTYNFNGAMDEIRIYDKALSATEITEIYNSEKP